MQELKPGLCIEPGKSYLHASSGAHRLRRVLHWYGSWITLKPKEGTLMPILTKLREFLDGQKVKYEVLTHRQAFTAQEVAAAQHVPGKELAKVVILRSGTNFMMAVLPAPYRVDIAHASAALGKRDVALASEQEFKDLFPQCEPGAMPPFGNLFNLPVYVDETLTRDEEIVFNAGTHTQTVKMKYADFAHLVKPKVAAFAAAH